MQKTIHSHEQQVLVDLLRELRLKAGLSQVQLAEALDEPQAMISRVETGGRRLDVVECRQWLEPLGVTFVDFAKKLEGRLT